jgi:hypothetical protein
MPVPAGIRQTDFLLRVRRNAEEKRRKGEKGKNGGRVVPSAPFHLEPLSARTGNVLAEESVSSGEDGQSSGSRFFFQGAVVGYSEAHSM